MKVPKDNKNSSVTKTVKISSGRLIKISNAKGTKSSPPKLKPKESPKKLKSKKTNPVTVNLHLNQKHVNPLHQPPKRKMLFNMILVPVLKMIQSMKMNQVLKR